MSPVGFPPEALPVKDDLAWVPGAHEFQVELPLRRLPRRQGQQIEHFNLEIRATGRERPDGSNPLARATLNVGFRTIEVENTFELAGIPPVELSRHARAVLLQSGPSTQTSGARFRCT